MKFTEVLRLGIWIEQKTQTHEYNYEMFMTVLYNRLLYNIAIMTVQQLFLFIENYTKKKLRSEQIKNLN